MAALTKHHLPAYSPLSAGAILSAVGARLLSGAREVEKARALLAQEFSADAVLLVDSGRSALALAIQLALPAPPRRRLVAIPAFQCYEVATAAVGAGCEIALYDIDPTTLRPDLTSLERVLRLDVSAVVIAPLYGLPVEWDDIARLTQAAGALAIEDAAQANGSELKGRRVGALAEVSVVSFGRGKGWTGGGGGALLLRGPGSEARAQALQQLHSSAESEARIATIAMLQVVFGRPTLYGIPSAIPSLGLGETRYHDPTQPAEASRFSAALLRRTLKAAKREARVRHTNADRWKGLLRSQLLPAIPPVLAGGSAGYLRFPVRVRAEDAASALSPIGRRAGIAPSYPRPLADLPPVAERRADKDVVHPGAEALALELITLPTHSRLTESNRRAILAMSASWRPAVDARS